MTSILSFGLLHRLCSIDPPLIGVLRSPQLTCPRDHLHSSITTSMSPPTGTGQAREALRDALRASADDFITLLPKVELHVHIEGTLTPALRWKLARRNNIPVRMGVNARELRSVEEVEKGYQDIISSSSLPMYADDPSQRPATFFEAYYSGCEVLRTKDDFYDLAMGYFSKAAEMNVRYCEIFFDPQSHTSRGVSWEDMMGGLKAAQEEAEMRLNVSLARCRDNSD